tara:strand:+ start:12475 stop:14055 length:1581 start_codon:yes stop_codon:yes gene_type:complete
MAVNTDIFLGSGASITKIPELDIYFPITETSGTLTTVTASTASGTEFGTDFKLVNNLYIGCVFKKYTGGNAYASTHRITGNTANTITFNPSTTISSGDYFVIDSYGAPCPAPAVGAKKTLLADTWLGITESITFPTTEVEMKQTNLSLGGSRNFTYQYKGIETAGAADLSIVANHGAWLYYFLGKCTNVDIGNVSGGTFSETALSGNGAANAANAGGANEIYINYNDVEETGPIFFRSVGTVMTPYVNPAQDVAGNIDRITASSLSSGEIQQGIKYTFGEQEHDLLPSFAMEQTIGKLTDPAGSTNIYDTDSTETLESFNFVKIARGCRVNTLTLTANENEELKMSISANTRNVHALETDEQYRARRGVEDETAFFNFNSVDEFREPFFFSDGTFKCFGHPFLKINTLTLTMNNNLQDRRFFGVGSKSIQESIPAQRSYELSFTGHVTDDRLYQELVNNTEDTTNTIELTFKKSTGEEVVLKFSKYYLSANNFPIPDDKGPLVVEATVMPRELTECTVLTHWMLQG